MDYQQVQNQIRRGQVAPLYLFFGEEAFLARHLVRLLEEQLLQGSLRDFNYALFDGDTVSLEEVINAANTLPVFSEKRLVVVKNAPWFEGTDEEELLLAYLENPSPTTCLVFLAGDQVDARRRPYKILAKNGIVLKTSSPKKGREKVYFIREWLAKRGKKMDYQAQEYLLDKFAGSLESLVAELEKLELFVGKRSQINLADVLAVTSFSDEANIFALTDALGRKEFGTAVVELRKLLDWGQRRALCSGDADQAVAPDSAGRSVKREKGCPPGQLGREMGAKQFAALQAFETGGRIFRGKSLIEAMEKAVGDWMWRMKTGQGEPATLFEKTLMEICLP
ncbi:MAG: DNA polymerase III subunit delta [Bacillota bacterium]